MYELNTRVSILEAKSVNWKKEIGKSTVKVEDFNTPLSVIDKSSRQEMSPDFRPEQQYHSTWPNWEY